MDTPGIDPTEDMRMKASLYPDVDEGTACTQLSFKANKKGFLYCGEQGGRWKAMFKLSESMPEAVALAEASPTLSSQIPARSPKRRNDSPKKMTSFSPITSCFHARY